MLTGTDRVEHSTDSSESSSAVESTCRRARIFRWKYKVPVSMLGFAESISVAGSCQHWCCASALPRGGIFDDLSSERHFDCSLGEPLASFRQVASVRGNSSPSCDQCFVLSTGTVICLRVECFNGPVT